MQIATRFSLALAATGLVIFATQGLVQVEKERRDLVDFFEQRMRAMGAAAQCAANAELLGDGSDQGAMTAMSRIDPSFRGALVDMEGRPVAPTSSALDPLDQKAVASALESREPVVAFDNPDDPHRAAFAATLSHPSGRIAALVLGRPMPEVRADLAEMRKGIAVSVGLFVVAVALASFLLGHLYVTRPLGALVAAIERVRTGQLRGSRAHAPPGELGRVADHFNAMVVALEQAETDLAREVESRATLERGLQRIDKLVTLGQLSASLAHEIGSPLQVLTGRARMLPSRSDDPEEVRRIASLIVTQTDRIERIVGQLLTAARRRPPRIAPVDAAACAKVVLELLEPRARKAGVSLSLEGSSDSAALRADVDRLQQVFLNLVGNAIDATPPGGKVVVRIQRATLEQADLGKSRQAVRIVVEDTGRGMSEQTQLRLFEPFYTTRSEEGGTGLGLAVVKSIVTEHDGAVSVESAPGEGSRFYVDLPVEGPAHVPVDGEVDHANA